MCVGSLAEADLLQFSHKSFADWLLGEGSGDFRLDRGDGEALLAEVRPSWSERASDFGQILVGSMKCAVWAPETETGFMRRNRERLCLGHYGEASDTVEENLRWCAE